MSVSDYWNFWFNSEKLYIFLITIDISLLFSGLKYNPALDKTSEIADKLDADNGKLQNKASVNIILKFTQLDAKNIIAASKYNFLIVS